jgi:hypothetical protein
MARHEELTLGTSTKPTDDGTHLAYERTQRLEKVHDVVVALPHLIVRTVTGRLAPRS